jgi:hypothetical protein
LYYCCLDQGVVSHHSKVTTAAEASTASAINHKAKVWISVPNAS